MTAVVPDSGGRRVFPIIGRRKGVAKTTAHKRYRDNDELLRPIIRLRVFGAGKRLCLRGHPR